VTPIDERKKRVRASIWAAVRRHGIAGESARLALSLIPADDPIGKRLIRAENPGEEMMAWWREVRQ
jgi:hypothetical protein